LSKYFFVSTCGIDTTASLRMFVVTYNTKYKTYITMSKSSTISLDVLNALSPQKGMLNASVKELENQVFTFHL
jgi:hypothetical protein